MRALWVWSFSVLLASCSSNEPPPLEPLSEACDTCLRQEGDEGCGDAYSTCTELPACREHVLCELRQQCYYEPPEQDCAAERGCNAPAEADAVNAADAFEACARDTCQSACGFRGE